MGLGTGVSLAGAVLTAELCAPLLLLCGLCCWPLDDRSDTSSTGKGKHPQKPVVAKESPRRPRRSFEVFPHKAASSATSLHLPSTSGHSKQSLSVRSHEEIRVRPRPPLEDQCSQEGRYHSAPSVIDEVLHRRDWETSTRELYIPLRPETEISDRDSNFSSPPAPHAEPESSSIECIDKDEKVSCKKHHTNIKSSRNRTKKERNQDDVKDTDATENDPNKAGFYIGEVSNETAVISKKKDAEKIKSVYKAKDAKQCINESIKSKERPNISSNLDNPGSAPERYQVQTVDIDLDLCGEELDRSGAMHHDAGAATPGSLTTVLSRTEVFSPSSVEAVGWEGGACYLRAAEVGLRARLECGGPRGRIASDGDILGPTLRPESGAFSESDLELELEGAVERPPRYEDLQPATAGRKETAI